MSFGKQDSESRSSQGLNPGERVAMSNQAPGIYNQYRQRADTAMGDPGGLEYQSTVDQLLPMGKYGMAQSADQGAYQLGKDLFTSASGNRAQRGFNTPYNLEGVLGDSMRMASSQLMPQANAFAMQRAQMAPALRQASFGYGSAPMQALQQLLAGSSQSGSESHSFGGDASKILELGGPALLAL